MIFSILITSYNDAKNFARFLDEIEKQTVKPMELVIADGGSTDNSEAEITQIRDNYSYKIRFVPTKKKLNIAAGYNAAVENCQTDKFIIMGVGNHYSKNFCESVLQFDQTNKVDFVYTPIVGESENWFSQTFNKAFVGGNKGKDFGFASNRGVLISKDVFKKAGLFYEKFVYAGEDTEYFQRAKEIGLTAGYDTNTSVEWETPDSFSEYLKKSRVNAIADMQMYPITKQVKHIALHLGFLLLVIISLFVKPLLGLLLVALLAIAMAAKIQSYDLRAVMLRLHFFILPSYYYLKFWKYTQQQYHFDAKKIRYPKF